MLKNIFKIKSIIIILLGILLLLIIGIYGIKVLVNVQKIENGEIELKKDFEKLKATKVNLPKTKYKYLVSKDDPSAGNPRAQVHIVEFSDFQCPYCRRSAPVILRLIKEYGDKIHFVYRDFPLPSHPYASKAAEAAECAQDQGKFWEMHNILFDNQDDITESNIKIFANNADLDVAKFNNCFDSGRYEEEVEQDFKVGQYAGVRGTPTFFINESMLTGFSSYEEMKSIIDQEFEVLNNGSSKNISE